MKKYECYGLDRDEEFMDLLGKMLEFNPLKRISPEEVIEHPFLNGTN
jgi:serine/threonine protein kinase